MGSMLLLNTAEFGLTRMATTLTVAAAMSSSTSHQFMSIIARSRLEVVALGVLLVCSPCPLTTRLVVAIIALLVVVKQPNFYEMLYALSVEDMMYGMMMLI
jgi:hypothetical protein